MPCFELSNFPISCLLFYHTFLIFINFKFAALCSFWNIVKYYFILCYLPMGCYFESTFRKFLWCPLFNFTPVDPPLPFHSFHSRTVASEWRTLPSHFSLRLERWLLRRWWEAPARRFTRASRRYVRFWSATEQRWTSPSWLSRRWRGICVTRREVSAR